MTFIEFFGIIIIVIPLLRWVGQAKRVNPWRNSCQIQTNNSMEALCLMKEFSSGLPLWLKKERAIAEFGLSPKRLRTLRKNKQVTHRLEGNEFLYESASLVNYADGNSIPAEIPEPEDGDQKLMLLTKEVLRKEREIEVMKKEKNQKRSIDNV